MTARVDFSREEIAGKKLRLLAELVEMPPSRVLSILIENAPPPDQLRRLAERHTGADVSRAANGGCLKQALEAPGDEQRRHVGA